MAAPFTAASVSILWIAWNEHRRTTGLCTAWGVPLQVIRSQRRGLLRWAEKAWRTLKLLCRSRPRILFVQNPSLASTALAMLLRPVFGYYLVVDAHNEGVQPFARSGRLFHWLTRRLLRGADATIVTNSALAKIVASAGGRALVLPDRLPEPILPTKADHNDETPIVAVISSFMSDEPIAEIIAAAATLPRFRFCFTGDARRFPLQDAKLPANVELTGYLADRAFWRVLDRASIVCDLTLKPDCIVCGAYEALALEKPMVLSDNLATREIFGPAAVLTNNEAHDIARAIRIAIEHRVYLRVNACALRKAYGAPWHEQATSAWDAICAGAAVTRRSLL